MKKEETMKEKKEKKLRLDKITVCDLAFSLERDEQIRIKGGVDKNLLGITILPVYCLP